MHLTPGGAPDWCPDPRVLKVTVGGHCVRRESKSKASRGSKKWLILLDLLCLFAGKLASMSRQSEHFVKVSLE